MEIDKDNLLEQIDKYRIDLSQTEVDAPKLLSIGTHQYGSTREDTEFATEGNFSVISGAGKSRKSFFKSLLVAAYIGGQTNKLAGDIKSHRTTDKWILDFDTEQSRFHASRTFRRVERITGGTYKRYMPFALRQLSHEDRLNFIEKVIYNQKKDIGLVIIDGIADLVSNVNDPDLCNALVQKLMTWTELTKCHIIVIIHTNHGSDKATGWLGSAVMKKAETIAVLKADKENKSTLVTFPQTRGFPIDDFTIKINEHGLPYDSISITSFSYTSTPFLSFSPVNCSKT